MACAKLRVAGQDETGTYGGEAGDKAVSTEARQIVLKCLRLNFLLKGHNHVRSGAGRWLQVGKEGPDGNLADQGEKKNHKGTTVVTVLEMERAEDFVRFSGASTDNWLRRGGEREE